MRQEEIWEMLRGLVGVYVVTQRIDSKFSFSVNTSLSNDTNEIARSRI